MTSPFALTKIYNPSRQEQAMPGACICTNTSDIKSAPSNIFILHRFMIVTLRARFVLNEVNIT